MLSTINYPLRQIIFSVIMRAMKLLNTTEAAEKLGVSVRRVRQLIAEGKIPAHNLGRDYAIEESTLSKVKVYGKAGRPSKSDDKPARKKSVKAK
jgi:excisionase family DNA binding protein